MANYDKYLMTFTLKIEEALTLVPDMTAEQKLKAVQHWNVISEKLQDIVNSSAADIGALALELDKEKNCEKDTNQLNANDMLSNSSNVSSLHQDDQVTFQPLQTESFKDEIINNKSDNSKECVQNELVYAKKSRHGPFSLSKKLAELKEKDIKTFEANYDDNDVINNVSTDRDETEQNGCNDPNADKEEVDSCLEINMHGNDITKENSNNEENNEIVSFENIKKNAEGLYVCTFCDSCFSMKSQFKTHLKTHTKPHKCDYCNQQFTCKANLQVHSRIHSGERPFSCSTCNATFTTGGNLKRHIITHTGARPFVCNLCDKAFTEKKTLQIHMRKHTGERPYECDICKQTFTQQSVLRSHVSRHYNTKNYLCDLCGKSFRQHSQLRVHKLRHDGDSKKKFSCSECNMKFLTRGDIGRHMRKHTGERPYTCDLCGKSFTRQQSLNEHKNRHSGIKPYTCKHCDKAFYELSGCIKHTKIHENKIENKRIAVKENNVPQQENVIDQVSANVINQVQQNYNLGQDTNPGDQLIEVGNFSNSPKLFLLQMNGESLPDVNTSVDQINVSDSVNQPNNSNISVVELTSINVLPTARYHENDNFG